jgi:hypothetical protein
MHFKLFKSLFKQILEKTYFFFRISIKIHKNFDLHIHTAEMKKVRVIYGIFESQFNM